VSLNMRLPKQPRSATVDKIASIFTKHIWQPYDEPEWRSLVRHTAPIILPLQLGLQMLSFLNCIL